MKFVMYFVLAVIVFMAGFMTDNAITRVPKDARVLNRLRAIERDVKVYYRTRGHVPLGLVELAQGVGRDLHDYENPHGRLVEYSVCGGSRIELRTTGCCTNALEDVAITYTRKFSIK